MTVANLGSNFLLLVLSEIPMVRASDFDSRVLLAQSYQDAFQGRSLRSEKEEAKPALSRQRKQRKREPVITDILPEGSGRKSGGQGYYLFREN